MSDDDVEIEDLLDQLDAESSELDAPQEDSQPVASEVASTPDPTHEPQQIVIDPNSDAPATATSSATASGGDAGELIGELLNGYKDRTTDIWNKINADRSLIDEYLTMFTTRIDTPESTKGYYVEALVSLINTKAATSMNATKILDSVAKIVATIKNMGVENSTNVDLEKLLDDGPTKTLGFDIENP